MEDDCIQELKTIFLASALTNIHESGKMDDFVEFARKKAKEDGMETEELTEFLDFLEELEMEDSEEDKKWRKVLDIIGKTTGCKVTGFKGDSCVIIENEEMSDDECKDYIFGETQGKIHLEHINQALEIVDVKLEFIEAMCIPFDADGHSQFCRFKVIFID